MASLEAGRLRTPGPGFLAGFLEHERTWHYEGGKRDLRLDLLRGFSALAMIVDHIGGESWLYPVTGGDRFFVSAAEAFVFISGLVMGIVYLNVFRRQGLAAVLTKAISRAASLYFVTVALTLSFAFVAYAFDFWWTPDVSDGGVLTFVLDVVTLHRTIYLADVLLMYVLLLLAAGPMLLLLCQGRWLLVLGLSWLVWAGWQIAPESVSLWQIQGNEVFQFPAWQVLFATGLVMGWHRDAIEAWIAGVPRSWVLAAVFGVILAVAALYVAQLTDLTSLREDPILFALAFDKPDLPAGRLVVFAALAVFAFAMTTEFWEPIRRATGWLLLPLGQNALAAYSVHLFVVAATVKLGEGLGTSSQAANTAIQAGGLMLVWLLVVADERLGSWRRSRRLAPALAQPVSS
jgi:hypothetical protein